MPKIHRSALMPYSAETMYRIVNDVVAYPDFLPWCGDSNILAQDETSMHASVLITKGKLNHWFSTSNRLEENRTIDMQLIDGPFKKLEGKWQFHHLDAESCKIELDLEFEFSFGLASALLTPIFSQIANTMVDSFCERARIIHERQTSD